jgi:hypothetical protein
MNLGKQPELNRKIRHLKLNDTLKVIYDCTYGKLWVCDIKGDALFIANSRDLAEAFILGVHTARKRIQLL